MGPYLVASIEGTLITADSNGVVAEYLPRVSVFLNIPPQNIRLRAGPLLLLLLFDTLMISLNAF